MRALLLILSMVVTMSVMAQKADEQFMVYGNCGMCKTRIEKAVKQTEGVSKAVWNQKTKMLRVKFDSSKTDLTKIHKAVAEVGHDTDLVRAKDEVYENLHSCCKYERKKE